jgi:NAD-dependent DNA ligase
MTTFKQFIISPIDLAKKINIDDLEKYLRKLSNFYYNTSESPVSDKIFDKLKDILKDRDPENPFLDEIGSPIKNGNKVKLPYPMGSLNKIKPDNNELEKWIKVYKGPYELSDKMDGISAMIYRNDEEHKEIKLYSRGDGLFGQDITILLKYINVNIKNFPNKTAVRGELIMSKKNFEKIEGKMANARNAVAGIVNSKTIDKAYIKNAKLIDFAAYNVVIPRMKQNVQYEKMEEWGFNVVEHKEIKCITKNILFEYFIQRREKCNYEIDGIVVMDNNMVYDNVEGNPKYGFAFKSIMKEQYTTAIVLDVEWQISKHKYIKPRIKIEPVNLVGVTIQYATAHNAKFIYDNNLGPGAKIKIIRSGDVIPKIMEVISSSKSGKPKMPDIPYKWNETGVDIIVKDDTAESTMIVKIKQLVSTMTILNVKYINEGILTKFVENGYNSLIKIIKAKKEDIYELIGEKMTEKIYTNLNNAFKNTQLHILMAASNYFGRGLGIKKLHIITKKYPNIMLKNWDKNKMERKIGELTGFQEKTINKFIEGFKKFKKFFDKLSKCIDIKYLKCVNDDVGDKFSGQKIVLTGFRDKEIIDYVEKNGGEISGNVSKNTTLVVCLDLSKTSSKLNEAKKLKIPIMNKEDFIKKMKK